MPVSAHGPAGLRDAHARLRAGPSLRGAEEPQAVHLVVPHEGAFTSGREPQPRPRAATRHAIHAAHREVYLRGGIFTTSSRSTASGLEASVRRGPFRIADSTSTRVDLQIFEASRAGERCVMATGGKPHYIHDFSWHPAPSHTVNPISSACRAIRSRSHALLTALSPIPDAPSWRCTSGARARHSRVHQAGAHRASRGARQLPADPRRRRTAYRHRCMASPALRPEGNPSGRRDHPGER